MEFAHSPKVLALRERLEAFMQEHVYPNERRYADDVAANTAAGKRWTPTRIVEELKPKARAAGLWNLFLPHSDQGAGTDQPRVRAAVGSDGTRALGVRGLQLLRAGHRQHGDDRALRHARAQAPVAATAACRRDPLAPSR